MFNLGSAPYIDGCLVTAAPIMFLLIIIIIIECGDFLSAFSEFLWVLYPEEMQIVFGQPCLFSDTIIKWVNDF